MPKRLDLVGQKFGYLTVIKFVTIKNRYSQWSCICSCGQEVIVAGYCLTSGNTKSCGCFNKEQTSKRSTTHGLSSDNTNTNKLEKAFYDRWQGMKRRCTPNFWEKNPTYTGIKHCVLWKTFEGFRDNQPEGRKYELGLVLSRISDQGNYTPENCRWVTKKENTLEMISFRKYKHRLINGELAVSVAKRNGIRNTVFQCRVHRGWSIERACTTPIKKFI